MLESRANRELCRNGNVLHALWNEPKSDTANNKSSEQEPSLFYDPLLVATEGFIVGPERFGGNELTLEQQRRVTEIAHLFHARTTDGLYPDEVLNGVFVNLKTKMYEDGASAGVSATEQPVAEVANEAGERKRTFIWKGLGKTALEVARSGYEYHFSDPAFRRVDFEVYEAERSSRDLRPGVSQVVVSPRMTEADAPHEVAKEEHLADDDAIRVYGAVMNGNELVARRTQALLVRDIPFESWVALFEDHQNPWGQTFEVSDKRSALSVMQLFEKLDLPDEALPDGPINIVEAVLPYINDAAARESVERQLTAMKKDQEVIAKEAEKAAEELLRFTVELAESLHGKTMTHDIQAFVVQRQNYWPDALLQQLAGHEQDDGGYRMTWQLAAELTKAKEKLVVGNMSLAVNDERALRKVNHQTREQLQQSRQFLDVITNQFRPHQLLQMQLQYEQQLMSAPIVSGGGCGGENDFAYVNSLSYAPNSFMGMFVPQEQVVQEPAAALENQGIGKVRYDICRTPLCPSEGKKLKVGGCRVCLEHCQPLWEKNIDPSKVYRFRGAPKRLRIIDIVDQHFSKKEPARAA